MRKIISKMEYFINSMIYQMLTFFTRITLFYPRMILRPLFSFEDTKHTGLSILTLEKKSILNFFVKRTQERIKGTEETSPIHTLFHK